MFAALFLDVMALALGGPTDAPSALYLTVTLTEAVLLARLGSGSVALTLAVLVTIPCVLGVTRMRRSSRR